MRRMTIIMIAALALLVSCKTTETPQPEPLDIRPSVSILMDAMPDNRTLDIRDVKDMDDMVHNSLEYQRAWEMWEAFSRAQTTYINELASMLVDV